MAIERWRPFGSTLDRWEPLRGLGEIQSEVNRLFDSLVGRPADWASWSASGLRP